MGQVHQVDANDADDTKGWGWGRKKKEMHIDATPSLDGSSSSSFFYVRTQHTEAQMNQITCQWSNDDDERVPFFYIVGVLVFSFKRDVNWKRAVLSLSLLAFILPSLCRL